MPQMLNKQITTSRSRGSIQYIQNELLKSMRAKKTLLPPGHCDPRSACLMIATLLSIIVIQTPIVI